MCVRMCAHEREVGRVRRWRERETDRDRMNSDERKKGKKVPRTIPDLWHDLR